MANPDILSYLKQSLATGESVEVAKKALLGVGWRDSDIDATIKELGVVSSVKPEVLGREQSGFRSQPAGIQPQVYRGTSRKKVFFFVVVALLIFSGGGAYAYFYVFETETPEAVLAEAVSNLLAMKSLGSEASFTLRIPEGPDFFGSSFGESPDSRETFPASIDVGVKGYFDLADRLKPIGSESFEVNVEYGGEKFNLSFEFLFFGQKIYLKVTKVSGVLAEKIGVDPTLVLNKWILLEPTDLGGGGSFLTGGMLMPQVAPPDFSFSKKQVEDLTRAFYKIFRVKEELGQEDAGGAKSYHYILTVDRDEVKKIIIEYWKAVAPPGDVSPEGEKEFEIAINDGLKGFFDYIDKNVDSKGLEVWIGKKDKLLRKTVLEVKINDKDSGFKADMGFAVDYSGFDEPVNVEEPKDAISIEDLMASLGGGGGAGSLVEAQDNTRFSDLATMNSMMALYLADVVDAKICESKRTIYASAPIKVPPGWTLGKNSGLRSVDGKGWLPVNFEKISSGAPIDSLPLDMVNDASSKTIYLFACDPSLSTYEFNTVLQGDKFVKSMSSDGGDDPAVYEVGTDPGLNLIPKGFWNEISATAESSKFINGGSGGSASANDKKRVSDLRQVQSGLELYYNKCGYYPGRVDCGSSFGSAPKTWGDLLKILTDTKVGVSGLPKDPDPSATYWYGSTNGNDYILGAKLDSASNSVLRDDIDGLKFGVNCNDPVYCVQL
ncbi:MAG: hypothetical protein AAB594_02175 [Patescibacteria group bacterium]